MTCVPSHKDLPAVFETTLPLAPNTSWMIVRKCAVNPVPFTPLERKLLLQLVKSCASRSSPFKVCPRFQSTKDL